jgi:acyl-coenzyme A thioesterase PaaI-like protein
MSSSLRGLLPRVGARQLLTLWSVLKNAPRGGAVMGRMIGRFAPYTGTIRPVVLTLEPGYARLRMDDRPRIRNHANSVHAIALMNLAEATIGAAMLPAIPLSMKGIPIHLAMDYLKWARGPIIGECRCTPPSLAEKHLLDTTAELFNAEGDVVARALCRWTFSPA